MWPAIIGCIILLMIKLTIDHRQRRLKNYPPGPWGLPVLGNLLSINRLVKKTRFHFNAWRKLADVYGPVLRIRLGITKPLIVVSGRQAVLDFLNRREFDGRPNRFELRNNGKKMGIVLNDGQDWIDQKRFLLKALKDFGFGKQSMEDLVLQDVEMLCDIVRNQMLDKAMDVHDFCEITAIAVVSSLWNLIAGRRCDPTKEEEGMLKILRILKESFRSGSAAGFLWQHIPILRFIMPKYSGFSEHQKRVTAMLHYFLEEVSEHKKSRSPGNPRDLIDRYFDEMDSKKHEEDSSFSELQLVAIVQDLFSAGIETTSNSIGFAIAYLAKYRDVQARIQEELDRVIGDEIPRLIYKDSLPYLNATIAEVSRLSNVAPTTIPHRAIVNSSILSYDVKKNWSVIGDLRSVHMDPNHWSEADVFRPERFIDPSGQFVSDPWLMSFGAGRRKCLGENLARISLLLFLARLLQKFQFSLAPNEGAPCLLGVNGFTIAPPHISIVVKLRR
ncbi:methyl farnesoate epoxidase-like [Trichogramma pretiosum]|uniref:methyl farnesoate epoxidase-like n=1 Tax=Trichogramma pretiosum TaxID=7493 RepID=UPI000C71B2DF|nr:methyl farnesoate epoxidase-like [Trichogramma pretiosum]